LKKKDGRTYILGVLATVVENCKNLDLFDALDEAQEDIGEVGLEGNAYHFGGCEKGYLFC
jgi:hypothetical protein